MTGKADDAEQSTSGGRSASRERHWNRTIPSSRPVRTTFGTSVRREGRRSNCQRQLWRRRRLLHRPPAGARSTTPAARSRTPGAGSRTPGVSSNSHAGPGPGARSPRRSPRPPPTLRDNRRSTQIRRIGSHVEEVLLSGRAWRARTDCHADDHSRCRPPAAWSPGTGRAVTRGRNRIRHGR
jgi:hypothetical protein